jgi:flagellar biosynthetic protein FlhB
MPEQPAAEKTEQPTPRRLQKAHKQGQVPQSQELSSVAMLLALLSILALLAPSLLRWFMTEIKRNLSGDISMFADSGAFMHFVSAKIIDVLITVSPIFAVLSATSIVASIVVSGLNFAPQAAALKWNSINPASGLKTLFNARSMVRLVLSIAKLFFVSLIVWFYLQDQLDTLATLRWAWSLQMIAAIARIIFGMCIRACIALLVIAIADAFYQKWKHIQDLKMTRQEVKQERRDTEGSPEVKSRIHRLQMQMSMKRLLADVPKANVILVNPTHVAVALQYEAKAMEAPMLVAKGADYLAEKIIAIARAYGVPIIRRPDLARTIYSTVEPGKPIPEGLYMAVAEVLAMIYRLRQRKKAHY